MEIVTDLKDAYGNLPSLNLELRGTRKGSVAGMYEHGNKLAPSIKGGGRGEVLDSPSDYNNFKN
jgi:hypothetical protein